MALDTEKKSAPCVPAAAHRKHQVSNVELDGKVQKMRAEFAELKSLVEGLKAVIYAAKDPKKQFIDYGSEINRVEGFNGETEAEIREESGMAMKYADKVQSVLNAVKILPPNMIVAGRHTIGNVSAICGFKVAPEMMDEAYRNFSHEE